MVSNEEMFTYRPSREARWLIFVKRTLLIVAAAHLLIGLVSAYRVYFQIHSLQIVASDSVKAGSVIHAEVVTYGRTFATMQLELVQDGSAVSLGQLRVPRNELGFYDPRPQRASFYVTLAPQTLDRFHSGSATLRATALGTPQWTRLPPTLVRELEVTVQVNQ